jgi:hypothetical protein
MSTLLVVPVMMALAGCGTGATASHHASPVVVAEAEARCPIHLVYKSLPRGCWYTRAWNGATASFTTPLRQWGVAYAFNCGSRPREFSFVARLPGMDHTGLFGRDIRARRGSGYRMYSRSQMVALRRGVPRELKFDADQLVIDVASECTWHVKAVLGSRQDVASAVPPVPMMKAAWWK